MHLFPPELEIDDYEGFTSAKDIFGRKTFGEGLGNIFANVEDSMVAVLDAPWGSGKSTFIKMWCGHMRNQGFPVIYFDAFKNDYTEDAFIALAGEVIALADEVGPVDNEARKGFLVTAQKVALAAAKGGIKKIGSKVIGEAGVEEVAAAVLEDGANLAIDSCEAYLKDKLEGRKKERDAFKKFGAALEILSKELSKAAQTKIAEKSNGDSAAGSSTLRPLIFVIDELDRCKPTFALDLLEKVKHFFATPSVHFLLVTHMTQLEKTVRFAYGMDGQEGMYLQKFYHAVFTFATTKNGYGQSNVGKYVDILFATLHEKTDGDQLSEDMKSIITAYAECRNVEFRTLERIVTQTGILIASTSERNLRLSPIAASLCIMKIVMPSLYIKARTKNISLDDVYDFMSFDEKNGIGPWCRKWWGFCIGDAKYHEVNKEEMAACWNALGRYSVDDRSTIVPDNCWLIDRLVYKL